MGSIAGLLAGFVFSLDLSLVHALMGILGGLLPDMDAESSLGHRLLPLLGVAGIIWGSLDGSHLGLYIMVWGAILVAGYFAPALGHRGPWHVLSLFLPIVPYLAAESAAPSYLLGEDPWELVLLLIAMNRTEEAAMLLLLLDTLTLGTHGPDPLGLSVAAVAGVFSHLLADMAH